MDVGGVDFDELDVGELDVGELDVETLAEDPVVGDPSVVPEPEIGAGCDEVGTVVSVDAGAVPPLLVLGDDDDGDDDGTGVLTSEPLAAPVVGADAAPAESVPVSVELAEPGAADPVSGGPGFDAVAAVVARWLWSWPEAAFCEGEDDVGAETVDDECVLVDAVVTPPLTLVDGEAEEAPALAALLLLGSAADGCFLVGREPALPAGELPAVELSAAEDELLAVPCDPPGDELDEPAEDPEPALLSAVASVAAPSAPTLIPSVITVALNHIRAT